MIIRIKSINGWDASLIDNSGTGLPMESRSPEWCICPQITRTLGQRASCQIRKIVGCACTGNAGSVFPATVGKRSRHASRHVRDARAEMHAGVANWRFPLSSREKHSRHSWRMRNPQFYVSGKKSIETAKSYRVYTLFHKQGKSFPKLPLHSKCLFRKPSVWLTKTCKYYNEVTVSVIACQITCVSIVYSNKTTKLCVTSLCEGNSLMTGEFPAQRASNAENVSTWWRHHINLVSTFLADILYPNVIGFCQSWKLWKKLLSCYQYSSDLSIWRYSIM